MTKKEIGLELAGIVTQLEQLAAKCAKILQMVATLEAESNK